MEKFVTRAPTWKTKNYSTIAAASVLKQSSIASASQREKRLRQSLQAKVQRQPLQETADDNKSECNAHKNERFKELILKTQKNAIAAFKKHTPVDDLTNSNDFGILSDSLTSTRIDDVDLAKTKNDINNTWKTGKDGELPEAPKSAQQENVNRYEIPQTSAPKPDLPLRSDAVLIRIHNDLNSPSAAMHMRAVRALCNANYKDYGLFDVPHTEQNIITTEERNPPKPPNLNEILKDVIVYVEVRTGEDNRSEGVKKVIASMGARVNDKLLRNTSHVVFKDGLLSTYKKARSWNIPVVSILWIEACKNGLKLCDPQEFPISNLDQYENPELYPKMMRQRNMQPDSECNKRVRKPNTPISKEIASVARKNSKQLIKPSTPTLGTSSSDGNKNNIYKYFKTQSSDSPATKFLNKINSGCMTPLRASQKPIVSVTPTTGVNTQIKPKEDVKETFNKTPTKNAPQFMQETASENIQTKTVESATPTSRVTRRSTVDLVPSISGKATTPTGPITRRRSSMHAVSLNHTIKEMTNVFKTKNDELTISEEEPTKETATQNKAENDIRNATNYAHQTLDISGDLSRKSIESTHASNTCKRRCTIYSLQSMDITSCDKFDEQLKPQQLLSNASKTDDMAVCLTPIYSRISLENRISSLVEETPPATAAIPPKIFSSTRLPCSNNKNQRLTLHDASMEIINQRLHSINESAKQRLMANLQEDTLCAAGSKCTSQHFHTPDNYERKKTDINSSRTITKKRRLFVPNSEFVPPAETCDSSQKKRVLLMAAKAGDGITEDSSTKPMARAKKTIVKRDPRRSTLLFEPMASNHIAPEHAGDTATATQQHADQRVAMPRVLETMPSNTAETRATADKAIDLSEATAATNVKATNRNERKTLSTLVYTNMRQEQVHVIRKVGTKSPER